MPTSKEYPFYYANGFVYMGVMAGCMVVWFLLAALIETALYRFIHNWPRFVVPIVLMAGFAAIWWAIKYKLTGIYIRRGVGVIGEDHFELRLPRKVASIPYGELKRLNFRETKRKAQGMILSAKGHSYYLEVPYTPYVGPDADQDSLRMFYGALLAACDAYDRAAGAIKEEEP